ncbi:MAG: N-6 DNA methylase [Methylotenera sp.]|nr:N-6 DNA methylase [Methylotenera sp.]MDP2152366.1 N-6 DNA methylase [Methylotenera sp.]
MEMNVFYEKTSWEALEARLVIIAVIITSQYFNEVDSTSDLKKLFPRVLSYLGIRDLTIQWNPNWAGIISVHKEYFGYLIDYIYQEILDNKKHHGHVSSNRKKQGAYFTPFPIAYFIVKETFDNSEVSSLTKILDPAVGTGTFISAVAHYLSAERSLDASLIKSIIHGFDKDETALKISGLVLAVEFSLDLSFIDNHSYPYHAKCLDFITAKTFGSVKQKKDLFDEGNGEGSEYQIEHYYDFLVMNPPYDRLKPDAESAGEKENLKLYVDTLKQSLQFSDINGSIDLYRLFLEKSLYVTTSAARLGAIIPRTFVADKSAKTLRKRILDLNLLEKVLIIPEKLKTFEGVTQAYCIITLDKNPTKNNIQVGYSETKFPSLNQKYNLVPYRLAKEAFPSHAYIAVLDHIGYELISHLNTFPKVSSVPFIFNKRGELDLTLYASYIGAGNGKLLRGRHIQEYGISGNDSVQIDDFKSRLKGSSKLVDISSERLACQQISNNDSKKRLKFSYIPAEMVLGNSLNYITVSKNEDAKWNIFAVLGIFNSILLDWRFNATSSNNHVNNYEVDDLPFPLHCDDSIITKISLLAEELSQSQLVNDDIRRNLEFAILEAYNATKFLPYLRENHGLGSFIYDSRIL